jgi:putative ABC transport system substrate-binding protein
MTTRRAFIGLLGGAATWPLAARAQQGERMRRIGVLMPAAVDDLDAQDRIAAFQRTLQQLGWTNGGNVQIDYRWSTSDAEAMRKNAADLVALAPDVILANGSASMGPLLHTTRTVPIVFVTVADPVGAGYVNSLARPGGNATGFVLYEFGIGANVASTARIASCLELIKQ